MGQRLLNFSKEINRRDLIRWSGAGAGLLGVASLAACSSAAGPDPLKWANWTFSLDFDDQTNKFPTLEAFQDATGIDVEYYEAIDDSASFYATIREQLEQDKFPGYDLFNFADDFTARVIRNGEVQEIDHSMIPNLKNMVELMQNPAYDPNRSHSIPWMGGLTGLCYNKKLYPKGIKSMDDLTNPDLEGRVTVLSEMSDTVGLTLLSQGVDSSGSWSDTEFENAIAEISERIEKGYYARVKGNSYTQDLETGETWAAMCWSGDVQVLNDEAGEDIFEFVIPESGATKYVNSILIPNGTDRIADIAELINFYYTPEIAAEVTAYTYTVPAVKGVQEEMAKFAPELAESSVLFPSDSDLKNIYDFRDLSAEETQRYIEAYTKVLGL